MRQSEYPIHTAQFSPDQRWLTFRLVVNPDRDPIYISPVRNGSAAAQSEWIEITDGFGDNRSWWSPDGNLLYFLSQRDGFMCIWAQKLDATTKRPVGEPFYVDHFHGERRRLYPPTLGDGMTKDRLYLTLHESAGNIWLAEPMESTSRK